MIPELSFFPTKYAANKMLYRTDQRILYVNDGTFASPNFVIAADPLAAERFVGTGAQIDALSPTAGDKATCTLTGNGFDKDVTYVRNAANDRWAREGAAIDLIPRILFSSLPPDGLLGKLPGARLAIVPEASMTPLRWEHIDDNLKLAAFGEDFTGYSQAQADIAWPTDDIAEVRANATADRIDINADNNVVTNVSCKFDLGSAIGSTSNGKFVLRCGFQIVTFSVESSSNGRMCHFGISDDASLVTSITQDFLGFAVRSRSSVDTYAAYFRDEGNCNNSIVGQNFARTVTTEQLFVEIIRTSATQYTVEIFSDANYTTSLEKETVTITSTIDNLRYLSAMQTNSSSSGPEITARVTDIEFYDGVSVAPV